MATYSYNGINLAIGGNEVIRAGDMAAINDRGEAVLAPRARSDQEIEDSIRRAYYGANLSRFQGDPLSPSTLNRIENIVRESMARERIRGVDVSVTSIGGNVELTFFRTLDVSMGVVAGTVR